MSSRRLIVLAVASAAFVIALVFSAIFIQRSSRLSSEEMLADARSLDEVQHFLKKYPGSYQRVEIGTDAAVASVLFISPEESEFESCSDEFCTNKFVVRPYLRVITDATERAGSYLAYCGIGSLDVEGRVYPVTEFRPFDEKNSMC